MKTIVHPGSRGEIRPFAQPPVVIPNRVLEIKRLHDDGKIPTGEAQRRIRGSTKARATRSPGTTPGAKAVPESVSRGELDRRAKALRGARERLRKFNAAVG